MESNGLKHRNEGASADAPSLDQNYPSRLRGLRRSGRPSFDGYVERAQRVVGFPRRRFDSIGIEAALVDGYTRMEAFFTSLGVGTRMKDLGITDDRIDEMADKCTNGDTTTVGNFVKLDRAAVAKILRLAV